MWSYNSLFIYYLCLFSVISLICFPVLFPSLFRLLLTEFFAAPIVGTQERGRFTRGCKGQDVSDTIDRVRLRIFSSLLFLLGWLLRSIGSLVRDTSEPHLSRTPLPLSLHTIHTSLPLAVGGSWRRLTPTTPNPQLFFAIFYSKHPPFSHLSTYMLVRLYPILTYFREDRGFIQSYQHCFSLSRKVSLHFRFPYIYIRTSN
jgi:hypothetical protein